MKTKPKMYLANFYISPQDRDVLEKIAEYDGDTGMAGVVRRLIRDEGRRRGLLPSITSDPTPHAESQPTIPQ